MLVFVVGHSKIKELLRGVTQRVLSRISGLIEWTLVSHPPEQPHRQGLGCVNLDKDEFFCNLHTVWLTRDTMGVSSLRKEEVESEEEQGR